MKPRLMEANQRDIERRIRAHGLDPASFGYRVQPSECIARYIRMPSRVFGKHVPAEALALYPRDRDDLYMTIEHDPHVGFRSTFLPAVRRETTVSVLTWEALLSVLDQWLEALTRRDTAHSAVRKPSRSEAPLPMNNSSC